MNEGHDLELDIEGVLSEQVFLAHLQAVIDSHPRDILLFVAVEFNASILAEAATARAIMTSSKASLSLAEEFSMASYKNRLEAMDDEELKAEVKAIAIKRRIAHRENIEAMKRKFYS